MEVTHEPGRRIEFRSRDSSVTRAVILLVGLVPLLAPYELLIRPSWRGGLTWAWLFCALLSAGAVLVAAAFVGAALFGLSQRVRFDAPRRVITYAHRAPGVRYRVRRFPFSALQGLRVNTRAWSEGPDTYTLVAAVSGHRDIEFGSFDDRVEAERCLAALKDIVERGGRE